MPCSILQADRSRTRRPKVGAGALSEWEALESRYCCSAPSGSEFLINATTTDTQGLIGPGAVASDASGEVVVAWESFNQSAAQTWGVYGRRFGLDATAASG